MAKIVAMMPGGRRKTFAIDQPTLVCGRSDHADIPLPNEARASRQHLQVNIIAGVITVEDLGSANGTWFEGQKIGRRTIEDRDILTIGETRLQFLFDDNARPDPPKARKVRSLGTIDRDVVIEFTGHGNWREIEDPVEHLEILDGDETRGLKVAIQQPVTVGRGSTCDLIIEGKKVSNTHSRFEFLSGEAYVTDLKSTNGTLVNRKKLEPQTPRKLRHGDIIEVGEYRIAFRVPHEIRVEDAHENAGTAIRTQADLANIAKHSLRFAAGPRKGERIHMAEKLTIGRHSYNNVHTPGEKVSNYHAEIVASHGRFVLRDLQSTNGTFLNGKLVRAGRERTLQHGDIINVGDHVLLFEEAGVDLDLDHQIARMRQRANEKVAFAIMQGIAVLGFALAVIFVLTGKVVEMIASGQTPADTRPEKPSESIKSAVELGFEFDPDITGSVPGWDLEMVGGQCTVNYNGDDVQGGRWCLETTPRVKPTATGQTRMKLRTDKPLSIRLYKTRLGPELKVGVWVRAYDLKGLVGIRVVWFGRRHPESGTSVTAAWTDELKDGEWTPISGVVRKPDGAERYSIELFVEGGARTICWDEVTIEPQKASSDGSPEVGQAANDLLVQFAGPARMTMKAGENLRTVIKRAEMAVLATSNDGVAVRQRAGQSGPPSVIAASSSTSVRYRFNSSQPGRDLVAGVKVATENESYLLEYLPQTDPDEGESIVLELEMDPGPKAAPYRLQLFNPGYDAITPPLGFSGVMDDVAEVCWGTEDSSTEVGFLLRPAGRVIVTTGANGGATCFIVMEQHGSDGDAPIIQVRPYSQQRVAAANELLDESQRMGNSPATRGDALLMVREGMRRYGYFRDFGTKFRELEDRLDGWAQDYLRRARTNGQVALNSSINTPRDASAVLEYVKEALDACRLFIESFRALSEELREMESLADRLVDVQRTAEAMLARADLTDRREEARRLINRARIHAGIDRNWTRGKPTLSLAQGDEKSSLKARMLAEIVVNSYPDVELERERARWIVEAIDELWASEDTSDSGMARAAVLAFEDKAYGDDIDREQLLQQLREVLATYPRSPHRVAVLIRLNWATALDAHERNDGEAALAGFNAALALLPHARDEEFATDSEKLAYRIGDEALKRGYDAKRR